MKMTLSVSSISCEMTPVYLSQQKAVYVSKVMLVICGDHHVSQDRGQATEYNSIPEVWGTRLQELTSHTNKEDTFSLDCTARSGVDEAHTKLEELSRWLNHLSQRSSTSLPLLVEGA